MSEDRVRREAEALAAAGDVRAAAATWERAGHPLEAAQARVRAGDAEAALAGLVSAGTDAPRYGERCVLAIRLAAELNRLSLGLDNMLASFVRRGPTDATEAAAFDRLADLYEKHDFVESAREALVKLVAFDPEFPHAARRLAALPPALAALDGRIAELPEPPAPAPPPRPASPPAVAARAESEELPPLREGVTVGGRYRLGTLIGSGGASVVFRATDQEVGDAVAVKVFTQAVYDPQADARMQRELMLSRQLVHPNIVRVFEMGRFRGFRYMTMELLVGATLAERLRVDRIPLDEGLGYLVQACAGLQAAHDLDVVHRDVKPANLFVVHGGALKVMDFGIARLRDTPGLTTTGFRAGTPTYMAPEQASDFRNVTAAADVYSLGVVAHHMFSGSPPFAGSDPLQVLERHRREAPRPLRELAPDLPAELERLVLRCLEKEPGRRFGSCRELGGRLEALRLGRR